ncbi:hypothetical protein JD969_08790 [Planctomycetota bacterium]|nr:hypothetical protein JD969_08790 [Planctomycetota bacterium]
MKSNNRVNRVSGLLTFLFLIIAFLFSNAILDAQEPQQDQPQQTTQTDTPPPTDSDQSVHTDSTTKEVLPQVFTLTDDDIDRTNANASPDLINALQHPSIAETIPSGAEIAIIPVESEIYDFVKTSMERRVQRAIDAGASLIVFEFDTYGGVLTSAIEIAKFIKDPVKVPVQTIAWVNNKAYSAGILIASATDEIIMSPASTMGDCAPILPGQNLSPTERAKALSPLLEEFRDNAREAGLDYAPFHAMCVIGVEVYYIQNPTTGQRHLVNQADYAWMVQGNEFDTSIYKEDPYSVGAVNYNLAQVNNPNTKGTWKPVTALPSGARLPNGLVHAGNTLFTVNQTRAKDIGLSRATIATQAELKQHYAAAQVTVIPQTWSEEISAFLTKPLIRGFLVMALLVGAYMEFQSPGLGIAGAVSVLALIALLAPPFVVGLAEVWHIVMFFLGFLLLVVELAFTPTFGLLGIVGIVMMLAGLILSVVPTGGGPSFGPVDFPASVQWNSVMSSTMGILGGTFLACICMYFITRYFGRIPIINRLILQDDLALENSGGRGMFGLTGQQEGVSGDEVLGYGNVNIGKIGKAVTDLRPAGTVDFNGDKVDVITRGDWISTNAEVRVIEVQGNLITVEKA